jgi:catechol 2,3-dioxygenase-like lactoylglutathione lyase family enzyme
VAAFLAPRKGALPHGPKPAKFAHVVYMTRRYEAMIAWYKHVFEAEIVNMDPAIAFMTYDDEHHRFAFANLDLLKPDGGSPDDRGQIGVNHVAYTYAERRRPARTPTSG